MTDDEEAHHAVYLAQALLAAAPAGEAHLVQPRWMAQLVAGQAELVAGHEQLGQAVEALAAGQGQAPAHTQDVAGLVAGQAQLAHAVAKVGDEISKLKAR